MEGLIADNSDAQQAKDRRDVKRTIEHWLRHASEDGGVPLLESFDFASIKGDWSHRFLICADQKVEDAAFVAYGAKFAALLGLPEKITAIVPLCQQIPERYCPLFAEGCASALTKEAPARLSGTFESDFIGELFRAVFLPIQLHPSWSKWLIFGSFNCRTVRSADRQAP